MNIPKEALDAASQRLLGTADSPTGWLSDLDAHADSKNGLVWAQEPGAIDVWHTVQDVLEAALPYIRAQIAADIRHQKTRGYSVQQQEFDDALEHAAQEVEKGTAK